MEGEIQADGEIEDIDYSIPEGVSLEDPVSYLKTVLVTAEGSIHKRMKGIGAKARSSKPSLVVSIAKRYL